MTHTAESKSLLMDEEKQQPFDLEAGPTPKVAKSWPLKLALCCFWAAVGALIAIDLIELFLALVAWSPIDVVLSSPEILEYSSFSINATGLIIWVCVLFTPISDTHVRLAIVLDLCFALLKATQAVGMFNIRAVASAAAWTTLLGCMSALSPSTPFAFSTELSVTLPSSSSPILSQPEKIDSMQNTNSRFKLKRVYSSSLYSFCLWTCRLFIVTITPLLTQVWVRTLSYNEIDEETVTRENYILTAALITGWIHSCILTYVHIVNKNLQEPAVEIEDESLPPSSSHSFLCITEGAGIAAMLLMEVIAFSLGLMASFPIIRVDPYESILCLWLVMDVVLLAYAIYQTISDAVRPSTLPTITSTTK